MIMEEERDEMSKVYDAEEEAELEASVETMENPCDPYSLDQYQKDSISTAVYPGQGTFFGLIYVALKGAGEAGEFAENVGKAIRDDEILDMDLEYPERPVAFAQPMDKERHAKLVKELGDQLWYIAAKATELGVPLSEVARINREKLSDRKERGTLQGSGDER